jgi:DNA-binding PadR family transcriptional regulator
MATSLRRLSRNQLDALTLLAQADHELAAIEVADVIGGLGRSSVYAALAALQRDGLVTARWDVDGIRPRRKFALTLIGRQVWAAGGMVAQKEQQS